MMNLTEKEKKCCRYLANEMSKEDRLIFEIELSIDNELRTLYTDYKKIWTYYPTGKEYQNFAKTHEQITEKKSRRVLYKKLSIFSVLSIIIIIASLVGYSSLFSLDNVPYNHLITTGKGERKEFLLSDSSMVILNSDSSLKFKELLSKPREVWLEGEAFFEITEDLENPFIVHTNEMDIRVMGTSFEMRTSSDKKKVLLETGKVRVFLKNTDHTIDLLPNEQLIWDTQSKEIIKANFNPDIELAWKREILLLNNIPLIEALPRINKFYGVDFRIDDETVENQYITGMFKNRSISDFIAALEFITNVKIIKESPHDYIIIASDET